MALLTYADRVAETTTTTGTGTIQLGGAVDGKFRTFVAGAGSGNTVPYVMVHRTANEWEVGYGVVTSGSPDTLTRAGVYSSSNGGSAVTFSAGTKDVFLGLPAGKTVRFDDTTGSVTISGTVTATTLGGTLSTAAQPNVTSVGTLSSLTVSGDLTVDTSTLKVDSANNRVGIGTASPVTTAHIDGGTVAADTYIGRISWTDSGGTRKGFLGFYSNSGADYRGFIGADNAGTMYLGANGNGGIQFKGNGPTSTTQMTLDGSGNLGLGVTESVVAKLVVQNGVTAYRSTTTSTNQVVGGMHASQVTYGVANQFGAVEILNGSSNWFSGGTLVFKTHGGPDVTTAPATERARITAGGYFKASNDGTYRGATGSYHELRSSDNGNEIALLTHKGTNPYGPTIVFDNAAPDNNTNWFLSCQDNVASRCVIYSDGDILNHDGVYGTLSDAKLKQDITDAGSQWDDVKAIRFRKYRFKSDVEAKGEDAPYLLGVVAQELQAVSPGLVEAHPDTEQVEVEVEVEKSRPVLDDDGQPVLGEDGEPLTEAYTETETRTETRPTGTETLSVKQSILLMKAAVALQEAMARIETLEARLAALEAQ